ncbi:MAG: UbiA-like polyprenyltransferase [Phycisphaeraceae bacterium]
MARILLLARDIKLSHTLFAMPFALLAMVMASASAAAPAATGTARLPGSATILLIILCMVLARTMAMAVNRWADGRIDATNPRTAGRAIPSGRLSPTFMLSVAIICSLAFFLAAAGFWVIHGNAWPALLSPAVLAFLAGYSFTKRFTWLCHLYLGMALAISPVAAAVAIAPGFLAQPEAWLLSCMVLCWVAGFDIIYALQDVEVDRAAGLHSMPAKLGAARALWISRALHLMSLSLLIVLSRTSDLLHARFTVGVAIVATLLLLEHALVAGSRRHHIPMAFFTVNGIISLLLGGLGIWDVLS